MPTKYNFQLIGVFIPFAFLCFSCNIFLSGFLYHWAITLWISGKEGKKPIHARPIFKQAALYIITYIKYIRYCITFQDIISL
jgi:hypothetical protein